MISKKKLDEIFSEFTEKRRAVLNWNFNLIKKQIRLVIYEVCSYADRYKDRKIKERCNKYCIDYIFDIFQIDSIKGHVLRYEPNKALGFLRRILHEFRYIEDTYSHIIEFPKNRRNEFLEYMRIEIEHAEKVIQINKASKADTKKPGKQKSKRAEIIPKENLEFKDDSTYSISAITEMIKVHRNTVYNWIFPGLGKISSKVFLKANKIGGTYKIQGTELKRFFKKTNQIKYLRNLK